MTEALNPRQAKAVEAAIEREVEEFDKPAEVEMHDDKTKETRTPGFTRMRFDWATEDKGILAMILQTVDDRVAVNFTDAYQIMNDLYEIVREPEVNDDGEIQVDRHGWPLWAKAPSGRYVEDYSRLGIKETENFVFQITTCLFDWEQRAAEAWAEAMFAKAQWEERFSISFFDESHGGRKTDEAMTQRARLGSREERYYAIFEAAYSRKVDALVKSLERISLRLSQRLPK